MKKSLFPVMIRNKKCIKSLLLLAVNIEERKRKIQFSAVYDLIAQLELYLMRSVALIYVACKKFISPKIRWISSFVF